jgi:hypothetical protein
MVVGEEHGLPEASARRLVRIDIQAVTLGRGSETSLGMMLCGGLRPFEGAPQKTLIEPGKRVRNVDYTIRRDGHWRRLCWECAHGTPVGGPAPI